MEISLDSGSTDHEIADLSWKKNLERLVINPNSGKTKVEGAGEVEFLPKNKPGGMREHLQKSNLCSRLLIKLDIGIHRCEQWQFSYPRKKEIFLHLEVETKKHVQKKRWETTFFCNLFQKNSCILT